MLIRLDFVLDFLLPGQSRLRPLLQLEILILQSVRQFMRQHWLLLVRIDPIEQIHRLVIRVVVARHLFTQQFEHESFQVEIARDQSKFLQNNFRPLQLLRGFVFLETLDEESLHVVPAGELPFYLMLDRQRGIVALNLQNRVDGIEKFLFLSLRDSVLGLDLRVCRSLRIRSLLRCGLLNRRRWLCRRLRLRRW